MTPLSGDNFSLIPMKKYLVLILALMGAASALRATSAPQHTVVYYERGRFGGWPANGAIWCWGNEIAVVFSRGWFQNKGDDHSMDKDKPSDVVIGRSLDGGVTWSIEPATFPEGAVKPCPGGIDFTHPDFALRVRDDRFYFSNDRARTWAGPFQLPAFDLKDKLTSRTDYVVNGKNDALLFLSVKHPTVQSDLADRAFAVRTRDGGKTFEFLNWLTGSEPANARSVMPATVRAADGSLVTLLRRRFDLAASYRNDINWIECFVSTDDGKDWSHTERIAYTDNGGHNGNPPSLVRLPDGRLAAAYGVRRPPCGIRARVSADNGRTWGPEIVLRDDARKWDMGYCRSVVRADGKVVTVYYYLTAERPENHIEATIWSP